MKLDVTGRYPWPGDLGKGYRVVLIGKEQPSPYALADGEGAVYSPDGKRRVNAFGIRRAVSGPNGRQRVALRELAINKVEVAIDGSPARLIGDFVSDRLYLEVGAERSQERLRQLVGALPLLQLRPHPGGRPRGSESADPVAVEREVRDAIRKIREQRDGRVTQALVAEMRYQSERELRRDLAACSLAWRDLLRPS